MGQWSNISLFSESFSKGVRSTSPPPFQPAPTPSQQCKPVKSMPIKLGRLNKVRIRVSLALEQTKAVRVRAYVRVKASLRVRGKLGLD